MTKEDRLHMFAGRFAVELFGLAAVAGSDRAMVAAEAYDCAEAMIAEWERRRPKKTAVADMALDAKIRLVVDYYKDRHPSRGKHLKPGHKDWQRIGARISDGFSAEDLCLAVDGNAADKWHVENRAHSVEMVFRNATKIESFIHHAKQTGGGSRGWGEIK